MMKVISLLLLLTLAQMSYGRDLGRNAKIVRYENNLGIGGEYNFAFESSDGTKREEKGYMKKGDNGIDILVVEGYYSYFGDDGKEYNVVYISDEEGFRTSPTPIEEITIETGPEEEMIEGVTVGQRIDPAALGSLLGGGVR